MHRNRKPRPLGVAGEGFIEWGIFKLNLEGSVGGKGIQGRRNSVS